MQISVKYIESLKDKISADDYTRVAALFQGEVDAMKRHIADNSPANLRAWQAARNALEKMLHGLGLDDVDQSGPEVIGSVADLARWLADEGYCAAGRDVPIKKSKVYVDQKKGLLKATDTRAITMTEAMAYVARAMLSKTTVTRADETEDLAVQKMRAELRISIARYERYEWENERDQERYRKIEDFELELAMQTAALDAGFRHLVRQSAAEVAQLVGGDVKKADLIREYFYPRLDELMDAFARMKELNIVVDRQIGS